MLGLIIYKFLNRCCGSWQVVAPAYRFSRTRWIAVVTPDNRPGFIRIRFVIEVFVGVIVLSLCFLGFSVCTDFCHTVGLSQVSFFLLVKTANVNQTSEMALLSLLG